MPKDHDFKRLVRARMDFPVKSACRVTMTIE
jgi:hypothetical protein